MILLCQADRLPGMKSALQGQQVAWENEITLSFLCPTGSSFVLAGSLLANQKMEPEIGSHLCLTLPRGLVCFKV